MSDSLLSLADVKASLGLGGGGSGGVTQLVAGTNVTLSPAGGTGVVTVNASGGAGGGGFSGVSSSSGAGTVVAFSGTQSGATITVPLARIPAGLTSGSKYYVKVWANITLKISASNSLSHYTFTPQLAGCVSDGSTFNSTNNIVVGNSSTTLTNVWVSQTSQQYFSTLAQNLQAFSPVVLEGYYTATDGNINIDTVLTASVSNASAAHWDASTGGGLSTIALSAIWSNITTYSP
jgi:hypothetical protein